MRSLAALLFLLQAGCGDERAVVVDVSVRADGDRLCLAAFGAGEVVFERGYPGEEGPPQGGSLTLVAGDRVADSVRVSAWLGQGGQIVARDSGESAFGTLDSVHLPLDVARCHTAGGRGAARLRAIDAFEAADGPALAAVDLDADGRDELVVALADGTLSIVDADEGEGTARVLDLPLAAGALPALAASLEDDCLPDLILTSPEGAVVLRSPGREPASETPVGPPAISVAVGRLTGGVTLAIAGVGGLAVAPVDGAVTMLADTPFASVAIADLTRDGLSDLVASGDGGARVYLGSGALPVLEESALPPSFATVTGPVAIGDLDANGALDVVGASGSTLRVARNRGDGLLEDRTGTMPATSAATITRIVVVDLDGDCRDDVVLLDADGALTVLRSTEGLTLSPLPLTIGAVAGLAAADVDGDGFYELALLERSGELSVWER